MSNSLKKILGITIYLLARGINGEVEEGEASSNHQISVGYAQRQLGGPNVIYGARMLTSRWIYRAFLVPNNQH